MIQPVIQAGIEKMSLLTALRVNQACLCAFKSITTRTGQTEVIDVCFPPAGNWNNVLNFKRHPKNCFRGTTVFTQVLCPFSNPIA